MGKQRYGEAGEHTSSAKLSAAFIRASPTKKKVTANQ